MFKGIVFEGGGATAIAHVGAVSLLDEKNYLKNLTHFVGSSAGSIMASAIACQIPVNVLKNYLNTTPLYELLDPNLCLPYWLYKIYTKDGIFKGDKLEEWFGALLEEHTGNKDITFKQVYDKYGNFLELTVTDITMCSTLYINYYNNPDTPIRKIVRRSAMMPLLYQTTGEVIPTNVYDETANTEVLKSIYHCFTDGGLMDNYPMHRLGMYLQPHEIIGVKLMSSNALNELNHGETPYTPKNIVDFAITIFYMMRNVVLKAHIEDEDWLRTIKVDVCNYSSADFFLKQSDKDFLFEQGKKACETFLNEYRVDTVINAFNLKKNKRNSCKNVGRTKENNEIEIKKINKIKEI